MKSKQKIKRKRVKARHQKPSHFGGGLKPFPAWGKLVAILGMTFASGLFLLVSVSAYFADYAGVTLGFNIPTYYFTVDYNSNGGSAVASEDVKVGESITEPTPPTRTGYDFASWHQQADLADTAWQFATNKMPRQNLTLHAKWTAKTYDITYNLDGGTGTGGNPTTYTYDIGVASFAPATGKTGHTFVGWEDENGNPVTSISKTEMGNKTLYARWTPNEYDITYVLDGGDNDNSNPAKYTYDIGVSSFAPATGKVGHVFTRWEDENGKPVTSILKTETGNKTLYARWAPTYEITYVLDSGNNPQDNPTQYAYGTGVASFKPATKANNKFLGWYDHPTAGTKITEIPATATGTQTLYARWVAGYTVTFRNFDGTATVLDPVVVESGDSLTIPDAPVKANEYFLGWAEGPNQAPRPSTSGVVTPTSTLYTPSQTSGVATLNVPDQSYLGYKEKSEHELTNITSDTTLYAVYYKGLKATGLADSAKPKAQDFIWNNAIWRVVNMVERNTANTRLVVKVSALTAEEVINQLGFTLEDGADVPYKEATQENDLRVHFQSQDGATDTDEETYFFNGPSDDGYSRSRLKTIIDAYYNQLADQSAVQAVTLNTPTLTQYLTVDGTNGFIGTGSTYNNWRWPQDSTDSNRYRHYRDARFETTVGGTPQAFALSYGDIHGVLAVPTAPGNNNVRLLNFSGTNWNSLWLRSAGSIYWNAGYVNEGNLYYSGGVNQPLSVRPALYLSID